MTKEEYKKNLIRMFDSIRYEFKGDENCVGISCSSCPFDGKTCNTGAPNFHAYEAIEIVEQWAKEHPIKTNADKFKEVFGVEYDAMNSCINQGVKCRDCDYSEDGECDARNRFWSTEYKPKKEVEDLMSEIERKNKPDVVEKSKIDKAITQLEEEKEFAYADFEEYNEEVLSYDDTDVCERDSCYIGLARAIEILKRI